MQLKNADLNFAMPHHFKDDSIMSQSIDNSLQARNRHDLNQNSTFEYNPLQLKETYAKNGGGAG